MTMIERVARAIYELDLTIGGTPWITLAEGYKIGYRASAVAAIIAMREPTPLMLRACAIDPSESAAEMWKRQIDAALSENP